MKFRASGWMNSYHTKFLCILNSTCPARREPAMDEFILMNHLMSFLMDELVLFYMMILNLLFIFAWYFVYDMLMDG